MKEHFKALETDSLQPSAASAFALKDAERLMRKISSYKKRTNRFGPKTEGFRWVVETTLVLSSRNRFKLDYLAMQINMEKKCPFIPYTLKVDITYPSCGQIKLTHTFAKE